MTNVFTKKRNGFTLVELLVVLGILVVFIGLFPTGYNYAFQKAKDTKRKNDIKQYQTALENFATDNESLYPLAGTTISASTTLCTTLALYLSKCLEDSKNSADPTYIYNYQSSADKTRFVLWARQENGAKYWVVCSNKKVSEISASNFGVGPTNGNCPI